MGQQNLFHEHFLVGIATSAIAEVVFRAGAHAFTQVALLQAFHEGHAHGCREIAVFAIRLLETVERGDAAHIDHGRERQHATHLSHGGGCLLGLQFGQLRVERAGLTNLLGIDGGTTGVDA